MYNIVSLCNYLFIFIKIMSFFSLKTDQNCLGLSRIMLVNGTDNSAVHSFQTLRTFFFSKLSKRLVNLYNVY